LLIHIKVLATFLLEFKIFMIEGR